MDLYEGQDSTGWSMSEKLDGVQGIWDGRTLRTKTGNQIRVPKWWTDHLPNEKLTGELWIGRGCFDLVRSIVQSKNPDDHKYWDDIRFMVFDGETAKDLGPYAEYVKQVKITDHNQGDNFYQHIIQNGGEGVVFTDGSGQRFKHVPIRNDDGQVIGYKQGRGRNSGRVGALILKLRSGLTINLGNGLDDFIRACPPKIGAIIRFDYRGFTSTGKPRFASFSGVRAETTLNF